MKSNLQLSTIFAALGLAAALTGCADNKKDPTAGYPQGVLPHNTPARVQLIDECGFSFSVDKDLQVVEGGTFTQEVIVNGNKSFAGGLALQGAPKGMSIGLEKGKNIITYVVPRGIVSARGQEKFTYSVLPKIQVGKKIQCATKFEGIVSVKKLPIITWTGAPAEVDLDAAPGKFTVVINVSADVKSSDSIQLELGPDKELSSNELMVYDLSKAGTLVHTSIAIKSNERIFAFEIDPAKMNEMISKNASAKTKKLTQFPFVAAITAKNEETKVSMTKNLLINLKRSLPQEAGKK